MANRNVILIDDDEDDREIFCDAINKIDRAIGCTEFENAETALKYLQNEKIQIPNWIFLDLNMPKVNGYACLKQVRQIKHLATVPVIIYSTTTSIEDKQKSITLGASGFLTKPTSLQQVCTEVKKWLI